MSRLDAQISSQRSKGDFRLEVDTGQYLGRDNCILHQRIRLSCPVLSCPVPSLTAPVRPIQRHNHSVSVRRPSPNPSPNPSPARTLTAPLLSGIPSRHGTKFMASTILLAAAIRKPLREAPPVAAPAPARGPGGYPLPDLHLGRLLLIVISQRANICSGRSNSCWERAGACPECFMVGCGPARSSGIARLRLTRGAAQTGRARSN